MYLIYYHYFFTVVDLRPIKMTRWARDIVLLR